MFQPSSTASGPISSGPQNGTAIGPPALHGPMPIPHHANALVGAWSRLSWKFALPRFGLLPSECTIGHSGQAPLAHGLPTLVSRPLRTARPTIRSPAGIGSRQHDCVPNATTGPGSTV